MKKGKIVFIVFLILIGLFFISSNTTETYAANSYENGDIRCPGNKKCSEVKENGKVIATRVTETYNDGVSITKVVKKTSTPGTVDVYFEITGPDKVEKVQEKEAYVAFILDISGSLYNNYETMTTAITNFSKTLEGHHVALVQFSEWVASFGKNATFIELKNGQLIEGKDFFIPKVTSYHDTQNYTGGGYSQLGKAFEKAYRLLTTAPEDEPKFLILVGDGEYFYPNYTQWPTVESGLSKLKTIDKLYTYSMMYYSQYYGIEMSKEANGKARSICNSSNRLTCAKNLMNYVTISGNVRDCGSDKTGCWNFQLKEIASQIKKDVKNMTVVSNNGVTKSYSAEIVDKLGGQFLLIEKPSKSSKKLIVENVSSKMATTTPFSIRINQEKITKSGGNWYDTNNGFELKYQIDGKKVTRKVKIDPEMYWMSPTPAIPKKNEWEACNDALGYVTTDYNITTVKAEIFSDNKSNYTFKCDETLTGSVDVHDEEFGVRKFSIKDGLGFRAETKINTNLSCKYEFDIEAYNSDVDYINSEIARHEQNEEYLYDVYLERMELVTYSDKVVTKDIEVQYNWYRKALKEYDDAIAVNNNSINTYNYYINNNIDANGNTLTDELKQTYNNNIIIHQEQIAAYQDAKQKVVLATQALETYVYYKNYKKIWISNRTKLDNWVNNYKTNILKNFPQKDNNIVSYYNDTMNNIPTLTITYDNNQFPKLETTKYFKNSEQSNLDYTCNSPSSTSKQCNISFSKTVNLKDVCISTKDGKIVDCEDGSNSQLIGHQMYYLERGVEGAHIGITYNNLGYDREFDIKMDASETNGVCYAHVVKTNLLYRQIDNSDPFIQGDQYNDVGKRDIGVNFLNDKYNFVKIAESPVWSNTINYNGNNTADYLYQLSKQNIVDIKKNSDSLNVSSYLGNNCFVNSANKYICPFARNISDSGNVNYFSFFEIKP